MFKPYDPNLTPKKLIEAKVALIKHLENGMDGDVYNGTIVSGGDTVTITIRDLKLSISVTVEDVLKAMAVEGKC